MWLPFFLGPLAARGLRARTIVTMGASAIIPPRGVRHYCLRYPTAPANWVPNDRRCVSGTWVRGADLTLVNRPNHAAALCNLPAPNRSTTRVLHAYIDSCDLRSLHTEFAVSRPGSLKTVTMRTSNEVPGSHLPSNFTHRTGCPCSRSRDSVEKAASGHRRRGRSAPRPSDGRDVLRLSALAVLEVAIAD